MTVAEHLTGPVLRDAREGAHLTQAEAAARLGVTVRAYRKWEAALVVPQPRHRRALQTLLAELSPTEAAA